LNPDFVATPDGRHAWASLNGNHLVRVDLETGTPEFDFQPFENPGSPFRALLPLENHPESIVVAGLGGSQGVQVTVYDRGVPRPVSYGDLHWFGNGIQAVPGDGGNFLVLTGGELRELRAGGDGLELVRNLDAAANYSEGRISRVGNLLLYGATRGADLARGVRLADLAAGIGDPATGLAFRSRYPGEFPAILELGSVRLPDFEPLWTFRLPVPWGETSPRLVPMGHRGLLVLGSTARLVRTDRLGSRTTALEVQAGPLGTVLGTNQVLETLLSITNRSPWSFAGGELQVDWTEGVDTALPETIMARHAILPLGPFSGGTNLAFQFRSAAAGPQVIRFRIASPIPDASAGPVGTELAFEIPGPPRLLLSDQSLKEGDSLRAGMLEFILDRPAPTDLDVAFQVEAITTDSGDVTSPRPSVRFLSGTRRASLNLIQGDSIPEPDETLRLRFISGAVNPVSDDILVTVLNDDLPQVQLSRPSLREGDEGVTNAIVTVTLSAAAPFPAEIDFRLEGAGAEPGSDFVPSEGRLVFAPGQRTNRITATILGDRRFETNEVLAVHLGDPSNLSVLTDRWPITILNDDSPPRPAARFGPTPGATGFDVAFESVPGAVYRLQVSTNLSAARWTFIGTSTVGDGTVRRIRAADAPDRVRFYRLTAE